MRTLLNGEHPEESLIGIVLAASSLVVMPLLGSEAADRQSDRLVGYGERGKAEPPLRLLGRRPARRLLGNALFGAWWLDPVVALLIAVVAVQEGREAWRGHACC